MLLELLVGDAQLLLLHAERLRLPLRLFQQRAQTIAIERRADGDRKRIARPLDQIECRGVGAMNETGFEHTLQRRDRRAAD